MSSFPNSLMDPGTAIAILGAVQTSLGYLLRLKAAFSDEGSITKLSELENRLKILVVVLRGTEQIPNFLRDHPTGLDELHRAVDDCKALLAEYHHAVVLERGKKGKDVKAVFQISKLALWDDGRLEQLHVRLDRHVGDLQMLHVMGITRVAYGDSGKSFADRMAGQNASSSKNPTMRLPKPDRSSTLATDVSEATLIDRTSTVHRHSQLAVGTGAWVHDKILEEDASPSALSDIGPDPFMIVSEYPDSGTNDEDEKPVITYNNPWRDEVTPLTLAQVGRIRTEPLYGHSPDPSRGSVSLAPGYAVSNASSTDARSDTAVGDAHIMVQGTNYQFKADLYSVSPTSEGQVVTWQSETCLVKHIVPFDETGIPFTRPTDKKDKPKANWVDFLPDPVRHKMQIFIQDGVDWIPQGHVARPDSFLVTKPRYIFTSRKDRQRFQEAIRGSVKMQSFRGLSITTNLKAKTGDKLARDVNVKIWTYPMIIEDPLLQQVGPSRPRATLTFARNIDNGRHEEIDLHCFRDYEDINKDSTTVTLRVRTAPPPPVDQQSPVLKSRRSSFLSGISSKRSSKGPPQTDHDTTQPHSRRSSTNSIASATTADGAVTAPTPVIPDLPDSLRKLERLTIEFEDKRGIRAEFCKAWTEAYHLPPSTSATTTPRLETRTNSSGHIIPIPRSPGTGSNPTSRQHSPLMQAHTQPIIAGNMLSTSPPNGLFRLPSPRLSPLSTARQAGGVPGPGPRSASALGSGSGLAGNVGQYPCGLGLAGSPEMSGGWAIMEED